ncbi:ABC transporter substrate-binding protein [Hamadaea sp. NPDC051192]|uniref:ABC transporter substrate-binding protein n=1 Tax=Hamadaea sp. NPDC051192 TaxID=3154940 RepID=UPI003435A8E0
MKLVKETIVPAFEKETGTDVEVTYVDWTQLSPKLNAAFAAGTAPDVFGHGIAATADLVKNDRIVDLTPYVDKLAAADRDDLKVALTGGRVNGKQYIMPIVATVRLLVYSGKDFKDAGLNPDQPPKTWEEVKAAADKLTQRSGGKISRAGLIMPSDAIGAQQTFATLMWSNGGELLSSDGSKATLTTPEAVAALEYQASLYGGAAAVDNTLGGTWNTAPQAQQPIATGKASMQFAGAGDIKKFQTAAPDRDLRLMPPVGFGSNKPQTFGGAANGLMINKDSAKQDLGWKFIQYMIDAQTGLKYAEALGVLPVRTSAINAPYVTADPEITKAVAALQYAHGNPNVPGWVQMRDALGKQIEQVLHGKVDASQALTQANAEVDKTIAASS